MIEYERKLILRKPLFAAGVIADLDSAEAIGDFFPPGDCAYFGVRYRVCGATLVCQALGAAGFAGPVPCELTIKGPTGDPNSRYEQTHKMAGVSLVTYRACVKQRYRIRGLHLPSGLLDLGDPALICTLDIITSAWCRPVLELEGTPELVDQLTAQIAADAPETWEAPSEERPAPRYSRLARPIGRSTAEGMPALWADQHAVLSGRPSTLPSPWNSTDETTL